MKNLKSPFIKNISETWKSVDMYPVRPDMYEVSSTGRVRNSITNHIMSQNMINSGYYVVSPMYYIWRCKTFFST